MSGPGQRHEDLALAASARPDDPNLADDLLNEALPARGGPRSVAWGATRARRVLAGRAWTVTSVVADSLMLVLAVVAALLGANAAGVDVATPWLAWAFPP